jgi:transcriptional regulator with XRE-family HTH domain
MNRIKILREELNMTQQELADKLGGAKSSVAMYENEDRKPSLEILIKLSEIFDCSIDYILGKTNIRNNEINDPLGLAKIGFNMDNYNPPTDKQKEQIRDLLEIILKDNKRKDK